VKNQPDLEPLFFKINNHQSPLPMNSSNHTIHVFRLLINTSIILGLLFCLLLFGGCPPDGPDTPDDELDPNEVPTPNVDENREFVSPPTLQSPIYECATTVVVKDFIFNATLEVFVDGGSVMTETGKFVGGHPIDVGFELSQGQNVYVTQTFTGATSDPSNTVTVTSYLEDYPSGLPRPRISRSPLWECGRAVGLADYVPGATVRVYSEEPDGGGGFDPPAIIATQKDFGYVFVPALTNGARIYLDQTLCDDESQESTPKEIVQPNPGTPPAPSLDPNPIEGAEIVEFWGPGGHPAELVNGSVLAITESGTSVGGQPTPGGGQQVLVSPPIDAGKTYKITQELCDTSPPEDVNPDPCSALGAPKIYPPVPGQSFVEVYDYHPGAQILVFSGGQEIGHSGPTIIHLNKTLTEGETLIVVQKLGNCLGSTAFQIDVDCNIGRNNTACGGDWPTFRQNAARNGWQPNAPGLLDPNVIKKLVVRNEWTPGSMPRGFTASPIVYKNKVIIGGSNGRVYCLDGDLNPLWEYPPAGGTLTSTYTCNPSSFGIASTAAIGLIDNELEVVVFGAPDQSIGAGLGSGRLFALDINTGSLVWASDEVAVLNGSTTGSYNELHEQIGYSSPLVYNNSVYVGIANHCDNPIQRGKVRAVELSSGNLVGGFKWEGAGGNELTADGRGGGVWNSPAGGYSGGVYFTTGNTRIGAQSGEPSPNHGLSLIRVNENTGDIIWKLQPVPYPMDGDPDWAAGALVTNTSCGEVALSTMKDGWAYGVDAGTGSPGTAPVRWQFPPTGTFDPATSNFFTVGDGTSHGDIRYLVPGAADHNNYVTMVGGEEVTEDVDLGFNRLHSINACFGSVRWIKDIPGTTVGTAYQLGPPSIANGIIYVGTSQGRLIAIADPSVYPSAISRCSHPGFGVGDCEANGYVIVKDPIVLRNLNIGRGSMVRNEPVIANDRIYISTTDGWLIMIEPDGV
jgi:hypothetical protein